MARWSHSNVSVYFCTPWFSVAIFSLFTLLMLQCSSPHTLLQFLSWLQFACLFAFHTCSYPCLDLKLFLHAFNICGLSLYFKCIYHILPLCLQGDFHWFELLPNLCLQSKHLLHYQCLQYNLSLVLFMFYVVLLPSL